MQTSFLWSRWPATLTIATLPHVTSPALPTPGALWTDDPRREEGRTPSPTY